MLRNYEPQDIILDDSQHEMCEVLTTMDNSEHTELESVFAEADTCGVGTNMRKIWENDKRNLKRQFQSDQLTLGNGRYYLVQVHVSLVHNAESGSWGNRWSPITIRIDRC